MTKRRKGVKRKLIALLYGVVCHGLFFLAGLSMFVSLYNGFLWSLTANSSEFSYFLNGFLLIQFPLFHSFLLTTSGKTVLRWFCSRTYKNTLDTTIYASIASLQLLLLFLFWSPTGVVIWVAQGVLYYVLLVGYLAGWLALAISSAQAGLSVQTGSLGWVSLYKKAKVNFPDLPINGLFKFVRHPIYLSFSIILWVSPYLTLDKLIVASFYTFYCLLAPLLKEKRLLKIYGHRFRQYQLVTPYFFPKIRFFLKK